MVEPSRFIARNVILIAPAAELAQREHRKARRLLQEELAAIYQQASERPEAFTARDALPFWRAMANGDRQAAVAILKRTRETLGTAGVLEVLNRTRRE